MQDCAIHETHDTDDDEVIAHMLQNQYNKEYDLMLKRTEDKFNRDSKGDTRFFDYYVAIHTNPFILCS